MKIRIIKSNVVILILYAEFLILNTPQFAAG